MVKERGEEAILVVRLHGLLLADDRSALLEIARQLQWSADSMEQLPHVRHIQLTSHLLTRIPFCIIVTVYVSIHLMRCLLLTFFMSLSCFFYALFLPFCLFSLSSLCLSFPRCRLPTPLAPLCKLSAARVPLAPSFSFSTTLTPSRSGPNNHFCTTCLTLPRRRERPSLSSE